MSRRFRTLDPAMTFDPKLDGLSMVALLLLDRLIMNSDDEGRQYGDPQSVWAATFPRNDASGEVTLAALMGALDALTGRGIVYRYEVAGQLYLALPGWRDGQTWQYQQIQRLIKSRHPAPPDGTCPVNPRGRGAPPVDRTAGGPANQYDTSTVPVRAELDVDRTGRGRDADTDTDRTGPRASPSPSPAPAGSGSARGRNGQAPGAKGVLDALKRKGGDRGPTDHRAALTKKLLDAHRLTSSTSVVGVAVQRALKAEKENSPEFESLANQALLLHAQASESDSAPAGDPT